MNKAKYVPPLKSEPFKPSESLNIQDPNTRIIQKNLVYLIGLPLSLANDEVPL